MAATYFFSRALQRHYTCWLLVGAFNVLLWCTVCSTAQKLRPSTDLQERNDTGICKSVDIRNSVNSFENLRGCRVVEGFVQILLFDNVNESLFANISFPELREITDYLLMYRVNGLRSLAQLFPNLAVIRGQNLFHSYAFILFEMSSLQEIGLYSLTDITHGAIRIDKNPSLCFVNSIDWEAIAKENGEHFIKNVKPENECPLCPGDDMTPEEAAESPHACPKAKIRPKMDENLEGRHLCWNRQHCQKLCPGNCTSCNSGNVCCDENCLGGCYGPTRFKCHVCKNVTLNMGDNFTCSLNCPTNLFKYLGRRCLTREECIKIPKPLDTNTNNRWHEYPYKVFNGSCLLRCPSDYMDDYEHHTCRPCEGRCKKECAGTNIDSIAAAQDLRGCTHINGSLEIKIRGGRNIVNELEANLNMIEEIDGYIKIVRSFPLVTLNFLKNLKIIHGNSLESQKYVFVVLDNQNLEDLWDWENRTLHIDRGRLFFHFNPKLCADKINTFAQKTNLTDYTDLEVATNGDKIACEVIEMNVTVSARYSKGVVLNWEAFKEGDHRKLLGYVVSFIEAPHKNVTLYDGRDACGGDGWRVGDVPNNNGNVTYVLTHLKPYTQYAFYVKTYTIASERTGAQSPITYFRTLPDAPSPVMHMQVTSNTSDSVHVSWQPPLNPYGNVTHYVISGSEHIDYVKPDRNFCNEPPTTPKEQTLSRDITISHSRFKNDTCVCEEGTYSTNPEDEKEILSWINFEDQLQNQVYVKNPKSREHRTKREIGDAFPNTTISDLINTIFIENVTRNGSNIWESFNFTVYGKNEFYVNRLHHFTMYNINVQACREKEGDEDMQPLCSGISLKTIRTQKKSGADNITNIHVSNRSAGVVTLSWAEPPDPNGFILTYQIEYKRVDIQNSKPQLDCITREHYLNKSMTYTIKQLNPGNYSLRLMASTQAGNGDYSDYIYFYMEEPTSGSPTTIIVLVIFILIIFVGVILYLRWWRKKKEENNLKLIVQANPDYVSAIYTPDEWEVPRKKIELIKELGQGSFGMVYEGIARDIRGKAMVRCAVKTVNEHATNRERIEFLNEASVMKGFDTAHVVRLLGVVSQGQPTLVVMELMANGDLKSYLRSHRPDAESYDPSSGRQPPTLKRIFQMAIEIADGMAYLSAKKFVHRDLAARNCMVSEELTVKIGDFGMTRDIYETDYYRKGTKGLLPVRWMAPESLKDGVFTSSSDVWSYGVVLWEMATLASQPYQGLSNDQVLRYVIDGGIMERPENCPDKLYNLMHKCWCHRPTDRPTFLQLCNLLIDDASSGFSQVSFYHSSAGLEARTSRQSHSDSQDDPTTPLRIAHNFEHDFSLGSPHHDSDTDCENGTRIDFSYSSALRDSTANGYIGDYGKNRAPT